MSHDTITGQLCEQTRTDEAKTRRAEECRKWTINNRVQAYLKDASPNKECLYLTHFFQN